MTSKQQLSPVERLLAVAKDLCAAVDRNHRAKEQPLKFTVPWRQVVELEQAAVAVEIAIRQCLCAQRDGQIVETHLACPIHGVKVSSSDETSGRLWTQAEWDLKNKQVDELEQDATRLRVLLRRFMNCRSEPPGTGWKIAAGAAAGDALNKVYLDAKKYFASIFTGSQLEPSVRCTCFEDDHGPDCDKDGCCGQCKGSQVNGSEATKVTK